MNLHGLSKNVGVFMIGVGVIFAFPIFALIQIISIPEVFDFVLEHTFWNAWLVVGLTFGVCVPTLILLFAYGADMIRYRDKKAEEVKSIEEKAEESEYKPEPTEE